MNQKKLRNINTPNSVDYVLSDDNVFAFNIEDDIESIKYYKAPYVRVWLNDEEEWDDYPILYRTEKWTETSYEEDEGGVFTYVDDNEDINSHKGNKLGQFYDTYNPVYSGETYYRLMEPVYSDNLMMIQCIKQHAEGIYHNAKVYYGYIPLVMPDNPSYGLIDESSEYANEYSTFDNNGYAIVDLSPVEGETLQILNGNLILTLSEGDESIKGTYTPFFNTTINNTPYYAFLSAKLHPMDTVVIKEIFYLPTSADTTFNTLSAYTGYVQMGLDNQAYIMTKESAKSIFGVTDEMIEGEYSSMFENDVMIVGVLNIVITEGGRRKVVQEKVGTREIPVENGYRYSVYSGITFTQAINDSDSHYRSSDNGCIGGIEFHRIKHIPDDICNGCSISSVTFDKYAESIGDYAFYGSPLTSVEIPNTITEIGEHAFDWCTHLTHITIPNSISYIATGTFQSCSSLSSVTIPESVTFIGDNAFADTKINTFNFRQGLTLGNHLFSSDGYGSELQNVTYDNANYYSYACGSSCPDLKNLIIGDNITEISDNMYSNCTLLSSVTIGSNVEYIGEEAFKECESLTSINIPDNVLTLGINVFRDCTSLKSVILSNSLSGIPESAFDGCQLSAITIPEGVETIGEFAFYNCPLSQGLTLPDSLTYISPHAFVDTYLSSFTVPPNLTFTDTSYWFGGDEYDDCSPGTVIWNQSSLNLREVCTLFNKNYDNYFTTLILGENVTSLVAGSYGLADAAWSVVINNNLTYIPAEAFKESENNLHTVTLGNNIQAIYGHAFQGCASLENLTFPNSLTYIGKEAFSECNSFTAMVLPEGLKVIDDMAFDSCRNLQSVTIPQSVTSISNDVFNECDSLTAIYYNGNLSGFPWGASNATLITNF